MINLRIMQLCNSATLQLCNSALSIKPIGLCLLFTLMMFSCAKDGSKDESKLVVQENENTELRDNFPDSPCYYNLLSVPCDGGQSFFRYFNRNILVDGCWVNVKYWQRECDHPLLGRIVSFYDFEIKLSNTKNCVRLLPFQENGPGVDINAHINALYKRISLIIELEYINNHLSSTSPVTTIEFIEAACSTYCIYTSYDEEDQPMLNWETKKCGDGCCKRTTEYVYSSPGNPTAQPPVIQGDPLCIPIVWTCNGIPGTPLNICNPACAKL